MANRTITFPDSPLVGTEHDGFEWDGEKWRAITAEVLNSSDFVSIEGDTMRGALTTPSLIANDVTVRDKVIAGEFEGDGAEITGIKLDQLADVNAEMPERDDLLVWNGTNWVSVEFAFIETQLNYRGGINATAVDSAPATPENGDMYINDTDGVVDSSWGELAGKTINAGNVVGWADTTSRWHLLGDLSNAAVTGVSPGLGIDVDDSVPSEPVVSIDRTEVDTWYADLAEFNELQFDVAGNSAQIDINKDNIADNKLEIEKNAAGIAVNKGDIANNAGNIADLEANIGDINIGDLADKNHNHDGVYEPVFSKNSGFNKNLGTTAGTVSEGNHSHSQYITGFTETDPTVPAHVKSISTADIAKWNTPAAAAPVSSVNSKTGAVVLSHGDVGAAPTSHTHSQYLTSFTESDPTVPAHVKGISTADIAKWNTPAAAAPVSSVNGKTGAVVLAHGDVGAAPASHTHAYSPTNHTHSEYSLTSHNHAGVYQPAGSYAASNHNHDAVYLKDSPKDGTPYQRQDGGWVQASSGGGGGGMWSPKSLLKKKYVIGRALGFALAANARGTVLTLNNVALVYMKGTISNAHIIIRVDGQDLLTNEDQFAATNTVSGDEYPKDYDIYPGLLGSDAQEQDRAAISPIYCGTFEIVATTEWKKMSITASTTHEYRLHWFDI